MKKEDEFDVAVDEKLGDAIEGAPKNKRKGALEDAPGDLKKMHTKVHLKLPLREHLRLHLSCTCSCTS